MTTTTAQTIEAGIANALEMGFDLVEEIVFMGQALGLGAKLDSRTYASPLDSDYAKLVASKSCTARRRIAGRIAANISNSDYYRA